jgi:hypothetical protein
MNKIPASVFLAAFPARRNAGRGYRKARWFFVAITGGFPLSQPFHIAQSAQRALKCEIDTRFRKAVNFRYKETAGSYCSQFWPQL